MTLDEAVAAVESTLESDLLKVDRLRARQDSSAYLLLVLDTSRGRHRGDVANGPRLVDRASGQVSRPTVPDALARAEAMQPAR